jgi:hypothetical protein
MLIASAFEVPAAKNCRHISVATPLQRRNPDPASVRRFGLAAEHGRVPPSIPFNGIPFYLVDRDAVLQKRTWRF